MITLCDKEKYLHGFQMLLTCLSHAFEIFNGNKLEYRVQYIDWTFPIVWEQADIN